MASPTSTVEALRVDATARRRPAADDRLVGTAEPDLPRLPNLDRLIRSPDSRAVFTALARLCVPTFSDTCTITITEAGTDVHHIRQPRSDTDTTPPLRRAGLVSGWLSSHTVRTWIEVRPSDCFPGCQGFATFGWGDYRPDLVDITDANYLTSRAVQVINRQRRGAAPVS